MTNIAPFDDPYVIAGQGTIGMELLRQTNLLELEAVFCCVGGGGLVAGVGTYIKRIAPQVKVIGVETYDANALVQSLQQQRRVVLKEVGLFADGAAVKTVGEETFRLCSEVVDEVIQVTTASRSSDLADLLVRLHSEGMDARDLSDDELAKSHIRYLVGGRSAVADERLFSFEFPERPGALYNFLTTLQPGFNISLFHYRNYGGDVAKILAGIQCPQTTEDEKALKDFLRKIGYPFKEETDNETYKMFLRE